MLSCSKTEDYEGALVLKVTGHWEMDSYRSYRNILEESCYEDGLVIDLSECKSLSTAAIGMILFLRQQTKKHNKNVKLVSCSENILKTIDAAKIDTLLDIEEEDSFEIFYG